MSTYSQSGVDIDAGERAVRRALQYADGVEIISSECHLRIINTDPALGIDETRHAQALRNVLSVVPIVEFIFGSGGKIKSGSHNTHSTHGLRHNRPFYKYLFLLIFYLAAAFQKRQPAKIICAHRANVADWVLFDARAPREATRPGGLGKTFDWRLLENLSLRVPFMLSGGLDSGNLAEAVRITRPQAVDVSSGVERAPGEKDSDKIREFIRAARAVDAALTGKAMSNA